MSNKTKQTQKGWSLVHEFWFKPHTQALCVNSGHWKNGRAEEIFNEGFEIVGLTKNILVRGIRNEFPNSH